MDKKDFKMVTDYYEKLLQDAYDHENMWADKYIKEMNAHTNTMMIATSVFIILCSWIAYLMSEIFILENVQ